ncbi:hypothetical protein CBR_g21252 [Chara braunii]|uniref:Secreted protein n=1 Tax=Chara braunii TaxID=69332 RepID=A0A388L1A6_CHABU|nr:hypothetical protein CBR_g21252 [Chara braunii]|eukprot:GBG76012.1 hypothetical protein CBR_g21252 [Chara braunii]
MPHNKRPFFTAVSLLSLNAVLCCSVGPVYDFICNLSYWEHRREQRRMERMKALSMRSVPSLQSSND